ncbi:VC2046/SO_2500 family protein [Litorilituus lipolyticus]|uniref:QueD like 2 n=1 Tax=Litorilituus lipolyticus TaxID=2491017 RepID=A0A502KY67_9GAMM|nr:VC2046/SO_2500 family protein [Litorilituus lipolyticus]TPH16416.1 hypothetical protein EPA86_06665 [Litorilituus lipolyticus]
MSEFNTSSNSQVEQKQAALKKQFLLHELQLGGQLGDSIHQARRADFSLMLSMLADDVREHSQFSLPQSDKNYNSTVSNESLRKLFSLPNERPLALRNMEEVAGFNQGQSAADEFVTIRLLNALKPNALAFRDDVKHVPTQVMSNTSIACQLRHEEQSAEAAQSSEQHKALYKPLSKPLSMQVNEWLKNIESSITKAPLVA